jgi:phage terminase large subunit GpA-like protein
MMEGFSLVSGFLAGIKPIPRLTVDQWADKYRYLAPTSSAEPGQYRTDRTPYLREIMAKLSDSDPCQEVVFIKGAQVGATEAGFNWLGYIVDIAPGPTLIVAPTDAMSKRNSKMRLDPMIEATPRLREKIKPARSRDSGNTTMQKDFPGGTVVLTGANSAVGLRSMPVAKLFLDEVDGYPLDLDGEGSPIDLAKARTRTFARRKIFIVSTPTIEGRSAIDAAWQNTDQRRFFMPCPECTHMQHLKFENLKWTQGHPEDAAYACEECGSLIEERHKGWMLARGEWRPTNPMNASHMKAGYHINSLYSPYGWYSWAEAAKDWEDAEKDVSKQKTFINTVLGETYKEEGEAPPWENLFNRREAYAVGKPPKDVRFLTAGVDVQKDRVEVEIVGWCKGKRSYSVEYLVLPGDTSGSQVWDDLGALLSKVWIREDGAALPIRLMGVDTGYNTQHVYGFCRKYDHTRVIPMKGQDTLQIPVTPPRSVDYAVNGKKVGKVRVWNIGVSVVKSELYGWLRQEKAEDGTAPNGYCHFPEYDTVYFKGLTAEKLQMKIDNKGFRKYEWIKEFDRNEPLDCRVYARAAAAIVGIDRYEDSETFWQNVSGKAPDAQPTQAKPKQVAGRREGRTGFW